MRHLAPRHLTVLLAGAALLSVACDDNTGRNEPDPDMIDFGDLLTSDTGTGDADSTDGDTAVDADVADTDGDAGPDAGDTLDTDDGDVSGGTCGDGLLDASERCDTALGSGPGACPTAATCVPADSCQTVEITGTDCQQQCVPTAVSACINGDGCCPSACGASEDDDCEAVCGNGKLEPGERCDDGNGTAIAPSPCPGSCTPANACVTVELVGEGCQIHCEPSPVTACTAGDGCCPDGCSFPIDDDCSPDCGNGTVDPDEACDTAIAAGQAGACPTTASCTPSDSCEIAEITGTSCEATCQRTPIETCTNGDGCCAPGCDASNDNDCTAVCGNGVKEPGELCDTSAGGNDACPTAASCVPAGACETAQLTGSGCDAQCQRDTIDTCTDDDGCCAAGCDASNDNDCSAVCGNGVREPGELCDTAIASGMGACPTMATCQPSGTCGSAQLMGSGCQQTCAVGEIVACLDGDGCCPTAMTCDNTQDDDCAPVCGNGVVESGEQCDEVSAACDAMTCTWLPVGGDGLVINEFIVDPTANEAIELYNGTASAVVLDGWAIHHTDTGGTDTYAINTGLSVPAGGFLSLTNADMSGPFGSRYTSRGAVLELVDPGGTTVDEVGYGILGDAPSPLYLHSTSRVGDGVDTDDDALDFNTNSAPVTLGAPNNVAGVDLGNTDIVVNEFFVHLGSFTASWVEVTNTGSQTVDLRDWILIYGRDEHIFGDVLMSGPMLAPGARLVLQDSDFFAFTPGDTGNLYLFKPGWVRVQQVTYGNPADGPVPALGGGSTGLYPDGDVTAFRGLTLATQGYCAMTPSEGGANTMCTP